MTKKIKTEFKINKDKRNIVCIITTVNDMACRLEKYGFITKDDNDNDDIRKYVGIAKCAPEDEWNEKYGRRLAEYRACQKRKADVNNEIKIFINNVCKCLDNLYNYGLIKNPHKPKDITD